MLKREIFSGCFYPGVSTGFHSVPKPIDKKKLKRKDSKGGHAKIYISYLTANGHIFILTPHNNPGWGGRCGSCRWGLPAAAETLPGTVSLFSGTRFGSGLTWTLAISVTAVKDMGDTIDSIINSEAV